MHVALDLDRELVRRAKGGEYAAFEELVSKYERRLYTLARRLVGRAEDAEDVVQETFASVVESLPGFREEAPFAAWLFRIATNHALKVLRKRRGLKTFPIEEGKIPLPDFIAPWRDEPETLAGDPRVRKLLDRALAELDEKYRSVFLLRDVEGFSTRAAAEALGLSEANVKVRLLRARLELRERLTRALGDEARRMERPKDHSRGAP